MAPIRRDILAAGAVAVAKASYSTEVIGTYLHNLYRVCPDFVYSVSREFLKNCPTPILVLPDDIPAHPCQIAVSNRPLPCRKRLGVG